MSKMLHVRNHAENDPTFSPEAGPKINQDGKPGVRDDLDGGGEKTHKINYSRVPEESLLLRTHTFSKSSIFKIMSKMTPCCRTHVKGGLIEEHLG